MKPILLMTSVFLFLTLQTKAQCDKKVELQTSKTYILNTSFQEQSNRNERVVIDITKDSVIIAPNGDASQSLMGSIKESSCNWTVPFKEGKMVMKTDLVDPSGDVKQATITIEAKDGKITVLAEARERPDQKMKFEVSSFEAKN